MNLPVGTTPMCVTSARGLECGRMLREEVQEVEQAVASGVLHDVLAELVDVLHLNLGQECIPAYGLASLFPGKCARTFPAHALGSRPGRAHVAWKARPIPR